jgi:DNA-binding NtrC family response regulator
LLYRLNTVEIRLPPLRDRQEDIPLLADHFLEHHARHYGKGPVRFDGSALAAMKSYGWPGNVRELDHVVERAVLMAAGPAIHAQDLGIAGAAAGVHDLESASLEQVESLLIRKAMERFGGNVSKAAEALGLSRSAMYRRMQKHGI